MSRDTLLSPQEAAFMTLGRLRTGNYGGGADPAAHSHSDFLSSPAPVRASLSFSAVSPQAHAVSPMMPLGLASPAPSAATISVLKRHTDLEAPGAWQPGASPAASRARDFGLGSPMPSVSSYAAGARSRLESMSSVLPGGGGTGFSSSSAGDALTGGAGAAAHSSGRYAGLSEQLPRATVDTIDAAYDALSKRFGAAATVSDGSGRGYTTVSAAAAAPSSAAAAAASASASAASNPLASPGLSMPSYVAHTFSYGSAAAPASVAPASSASAVYANPIAAVTSVSAADRAEAAAAAHSATSGTARPAATVIINKSSVVVEALTVERERVMAQVHSLQSDLASAKAELDIARNRIRSLEDEALQHRKLVLDAAVSDSEVAVASTAASAAAAASSPLRSSGSSHSGSGSGSGSASGSSSKARVGAGSQAAAAQMPRTPAQQAEDEVVLAEIHADPVRSAVLLRGQLVEKEVLLAEATSALRASEVELATVKEQLAGVVSGQLAIPSAATTAAAEAAAESKWAPLLKESEQRAAAAAAAAAAQIESLKAAAAEATARAEAAEAAAARDAEAARTAAAQLNAVQALSQAAIADRDAMRAEIAQASQARVDTASSEAALRQEVVDLRAALAGAKEIAAEAAAKAAAELEAVRATVAAAEARAQAAELTAAEAVQRCKTAEAKMEGAQELARSALADRDAARADAGEAAHSIVEQATAAAAARQEVIDVRAKAAADKAAADAAVAAAVEERDAARREAAAARAEVSSAVAAAVAREQETMRSVTSNATDAMALLAAKEAEVDKLRFSMEQRAASYLSTISTLEKQVEFYRGLMTRQSTPEGEAGAAEGGAGGESSGAPNANEGASDSFQRIDTVYKTMEDFNAAMTQVGMKEGCANLVVGIDCTKSNLWNGTSSFGGRSLHDVSGDPVSDPNPYEQIIRMLGTQLACFDDDGVIPTYGFGDKMTADVDVFAFHDTSASADGGCKGVEDVLKTYRDTIPTVALAGPTNFAPIIRKALAHVKDTKRFTILLLLADNGVSAGQNQDTEKALMEASYWPLVVICVGIGDAAWDVMEKFDSELPERKFDNFQFVEYNRVLDKARSSGAPLSTVLTLMAMAEIPEQYAQAKKLNMIK